MSELLQKLHTQLAECKWQDMARQLAEESYALTEQIVDPQTCATIADWYEQENCFRSTVNMNRYQFGSGEYKYFNYPLNPMLQMLRESIYAHLVPIANHWSKILNLNIFWPPSLSEFLAVNASAGQVKPTPLMLNYRESDYNCLHQDKYGEHYFPFQALLLLNKPGKDFTGGEFSLVENRPRLQSKVNVVPIEQGQLVIFPNQIGVRKGQNGIYRTQVRHGVSKIRSGQRRCLGIIFHDAI
jgi:hypothetical protein